MHNGKQCRNEYKLYANWKKCFFMVPKIVAKYCGERFPIKRPSDGDTALTHCFIHFSYNKFRHLNDDDVCSCVRVCENGNSVLRLLLYNYRLSRILMRYLIRAAGILFLCLKCKITCAINSME